MTRADFLKKLGIAMGASALPLTALATTMVDDTISDDVLGKKIQVFYFDKSYKEMTRWTQPKDKLSRYYLSKQEAYITYILASSKVTTNVMRAIQDVAYYTKYCLPYFGGHHPQEYKEYTSKDILTKEVTLEELLNHNIDKRVDIDYVDQSHSGNAKVMNDKWLEREAKKQKKKSK